MVNQLTSIVHPTEDVLEAYALNRLSETDTCVAEEHLLICSTCQKTLQNLDEYIRLMKLATAGYLESRAAKPVWQRVLGWPDGVHRVPINILVFVLGGICVTVLASWKLEPRPGPPAAPVAVSLMAFRGEGIVTVVPAGMMLDLAIDTTGLPAASSFRLEAVNAAGRPIWEAPAVAGDGKLAARVSTGLKPGIYWVRLYSDGELVREFGLKGGG